MPKWRNGRRRGFKIPRREACRFESGLGYHSTFRKRLFHAASEFPEGDSADLQVLPRDSDVFSVIRAFEMCHLFSRVFNLVAKRLFVRVS